jgi:flavin-dependent dehydrogenase
MSKHYDLIIIGAGPAGLMAAKTAAEKGLEVLLVERKKRISQVQRTCCASFYLEPNYMSETNQVEEGKLIFPRNGFSVDYSGPLWPIKEKLGFSPGGYKWHMVRFASEDYSKDTPLSLVLDKEVLLEGLLGEAEQLGVTVMNESKGKKIENTANGVRVEINSKGKYVLIEGKKAIIADGVNSRMVESMGLNKDRKVMGSRAMLVEYVMDGVDNPYPNAVLTFDGEKICKSGNVRLWPNAKGLPRILGFNTLTFSTRFESPKRNIDFFINSSPYASWFKHAKIIEKTGGSIVPRTAIPEPCVGNILVISDAAACIEVENQGAMMCGFKSGNAVYEELRGLDGFKRYVEWWKSSFEFNNPDLLKGLAVIPAINVGGYSDEDIDYLFSLVDGEEIPGTCSQYRSGVAKWKAMLKHIGKIKKERPALYEKVKGVMDLNF